MEVSWVLSVEMVQEMELEEPSENRWTKIVKGYRLCWVVGVMRRSLLVKLTMCQEAPCSLEGWVTAEESAQIDETPFPTRTR
jgi:hypothetical protein